MIASSSSGKYQMIRFLILIAFLFAGTTGCKNSQSKDNKIDTDSLLIQLPKAAPLADSEKQRISYACELWYDSVLKNTGFNGGILVAKNGQVIFEKYKGTDHLGGKDSINNNTQFHIASVSKTITAMALMKLWQENKFQLDDEFSKYFPEFNYSGVTIRSLLNHRSGLPNYLYFMEDLGWDKKKFITNKDLLNTMIARKAEIKNIGTPNRNFSYCNTNYALLALLIEQLSGKTYPQYLHDEFFRPLQMRNTYVFTPADSLKVPPSYDWRGSEIPLNFLDYVYGDKNIFSTPHDLLTWDRALSSNMIFKPEALEQAYMPYSNERPGIKNYGLGWRMNIYPTGKKMIFHNGWWHGNNAVFIRLLDEDATIIVVSNRFSSAVYKARHLVNIFGNYFQGDGDDENESQSTVSVPDSQSQRTATLKEKLRDRSR